MQNKDQLTYNLKKVSAILETLYLLGFELKEDSLKTLLYESSETINKSLELLEVKECQTLQK